MLLVLYVLVVCRPSLARWACNNREHCSYLETGHCSAKWFACCSFSALNVSSGCLTKNTPATAALVVRLCKFCAGCCGNTDCQGTGFALQSVKDLFKWHLQLIEKNSTARCVACCGMNVLYAHQRAPLKTVTRQARQGAPGYLFACCFLGSFPHVAGRCALHAKPDRGCRATLCAYVL